MFDDQMVKLFLFFTADVLQAIPKIWVHWAWSTIKTSKNWFVWKCGYPGMWLLINIVQTKWPCFLGLVRPFSDNPKSNIAENISPLNIPICHGQLSSHPNFWLWYILSKIQIDYVYIIHPMKFHKNSSHSSPIAHCQIILSPLHPHSMVLNPSSIPKSLWPKLVLPPTKLRQA